MIEGGFAVGHELNELSGELMFMPGAGVSDWATVFDHAEVIRHAPGETVVAAGDSGRALYFLTEGTLAVALEGRFLKHIEAPSVVGELAFLDGRPRSAELRAETEVEVARMDTAAFEALSARHPELGRRMLEELGRVLATRLRAMTDLLARS